MAKKTETKEEKTPTPEQPKMCGIIMPIADTHDYPSGHWNEVCSILIDAIKLAGFESRLVSDDVAIGLIHERIVTNIYNDDVVVCDVSSKNPNVMFELGMRLAFDKPTIIVKDELTGYSFDTGVIEHINYPSTLRFNDIVNFKNELTKKIRATHKKAVSSPNFSPFLKSFGRTIVPAQIQETTISEVNFLKEQLTDIKTEIKNLRVDRYDSVPNRNLSKPPTIIRNKSNLQLKDIAIKVLENFPEFTKNNFSIAILDKEARRLGFSLNMKDLEKLWEIIKKVQTIRGINI